MGISWSRRYQSESSKFEALLTKTIAERSRLPDKQIHSLNQLLLKFPYLHKGFQKTRELFTTLDTNNDGAIDIQELLKNSSVLGIREADQSVLQNIFNAADMDGSHEIDTGEFIIMLALFHLLKGEDVDSQLDADVRDTLQLVEDIFCFFDTSEDGSIEQVEVKAAIDNADSGSCVPSMFQHFMQLDWNHNGRISYPELLFGLFNWVEETELDTETN